MRYSPRRLAPLTVCAVFLVTLILLRLTADGRSWRERASQSVGLGDSYNTEDDVEGSQGSSSNGGHAKPEVLPPKPSYVPGTPKPLGYNYSRILVMARLTSENVDWVEEELPGLQTAIYIADDLDAPLHPPENKGHEVMIYLTYIIENYDDLPDVVMFMHSHRFTWHNNEMLNFDSVEMIKRLSSERVQREGYMNMRCHWNPGCPAWMHPGTVTESWERQEETSMAKAWSEIFPLDQVPLIIAQPCCAQFAVSRERIQSTPKTTFEFYRSWLTRTELDDSMSGRIWEYLWHVAFTGEPSFCPLQSACYCDGYGMCFGGEEPFDEYFEVRNKKMSLEKELSDWNLKASTIEKLKSGGKLNEGSDIEVPQYAGDVELKHWIEKLEFDLQVRRDQALVRGEDPRIRALESNRTWNEGDGY